MRAAAERDDALRAQGIDPETYRPEAATRSEPAAREPGSAAGLPTPARSQRRRMSVRRILLIGTTLILAIAVVGSVLLWQRVAAFNASVSTEPMLSASLFGPLGGKDRVNVLMIGFAGEQHHGGTYLADSLNILSIDPVSDTTTLIPIPRDLWIQGLPQLPKGGKVNEVFADGWIVGGEEEAGRAEAAVLSAVTGLTIDHWMAIDFAGFSGLVDAVGGVTVNNPRAFAYTWSEANYQAGDWNGGSFAKGIIALDGAKALDYARARYTSVPAESSDFARSVRQQRVLAALKAKLGAGGAGSLGPALAMMDALKGRLRTNLSAADLLLLSGHLGVERRLELKEDVILKAGFNDAGQYILFPIGAKGLGDYAPLRAYIAAQLARPISTPAPSPTPTPSR
jgi:polyisoprenyl-teichoic acid--peptidoglycan teichoic acid transferase